MRTLYIFLLLPSLGFSQIGIGTTEPTSALDVNGDLRVRTTNSNLRESVAKDSVLVVDNLGNVGRVSAKQIVNSYLKSYVKGSFSTGGTQSISVVSGTKIVPFNAEEFDENNEFDTGTYTYTAKNTGLYSIWAQVKISGTVNLGLDFGIGILKNGTLVAKNSFANIGVDLGLVTIGVTPPIRNITTLVKLNAGETISFNVYYGTLSASVGLSGSNTESFFTIEQVR